MLTLDSRKYSFKGIKSGLYVFKRKGTREWLIVEECRMVTPENGFIRYFNAVKVKSDSLTDGCPGQVQFNLEE